MHDPLGDDLGLMYGDEIADRVTWSGAPFNALLELTGSAVLDGRAQALDPTLTYPAHITLPVGAELVIRGRRYAVVADPEPIGDGRELIAQLRAL